MNRGPAMLVSRRQQRNRRALIQAYRPARLRTRHGSATQPTLSSSTRASSWRSALTATAVEAAAGSRAQPATTTAPSACATAMGPPKSSSAVGEMGVTSRRKTRAVRTCVAQA